jgi:hypothetical protein
MRKLSSPPLDRAAAAFGLYWDAKHSSFLIQGHDDDAVLTPDQLADLARALLSASVTKGTN